MFEFNEQCIKDIIRNHKQNCAQQRSLENKLRNYEIPSTKVQLHALSEITTRSQMVEEWISLLSEDEAFVITKHLMEELDWPRIEAEHRNKWGEFGKTERTLKRYQKRAIAKILHFVRNQIQDDDFECCCASEYE